MTIKIFGEKKKEKTRATSGGERALCLLPPSFSFPSFNRIWPSYKLPSNLRMKKDLQG